MNSSKFLALEINNLTVAYNHTPVLFNVDFSVPQQTLLGVVGPNGAGKTTLIKAILGLIKPIAGRIRIFGTSYYEQMKKIAYVPQRTSVDWDFPITVYDVVLMGCYGRLGWMRRPSKRDKEKALQVLEQVDLVAYASRPIGQLSGGQQQRVFLARALMQDAALYLMDEPFAGVDMVTEKIMISILKQLRSEGKTIVIVHHDVQTLAEYFDWLLLLNVKRIACGPINEVLMPEYICAAYGKRTIFSDRLREKKG